MHKEAEGDVVAGHFRAADIGISMGWRWAQILATIISAAFVAGLMWQQNTNTKESLAALQTSVAILQKSSGDSALLLDRLNNRDLAKDRDIARHDAMIAELRSQLDQIRNMREAYVYAQAVRPRVQPNTSPP